MKSHGNDHFEGRESIECTPDPSRLADANDLSDLWSPNDEPDDTSQKEDLGQLLLKSGALDASLLTAARNVAANTPGITLADVLLDGNVDEVSIQQAIAKLRALDFERIDIARFEPNNYLDKLGMDFCQTHGVLPLRVSGMRLVLGVTHPDDLIIIDEVGHKLGMPIKSVVVCHGDVKAIVASLKEGQETDINVNDIIRGIEEDDVEVIHTKDEEIDLEKMAGESPVIRFVNYLIFNAIKEGVSDIHVEPQEKKLQVRYRIDGVLFEAMNPPAHMHAAIISRLKIMGNLDIAERRLPQDGRIRAMVHGRKLDLRLSTLPTAQGEKAVLRILDTQSIQVALHELGMDKDNLMMWKHHISEPHGIILVTGPTGSGKTTTLYASLAQMDRGRLNISTVEDPVEYHLNGINQTQAHEKIGMTFAAALRSLLRQDPDVIMVGEIRDSETARVAIQASLTGHLVLSTLHTNDAPSSMTRLINIGIEPYLLGTAVNACLAQRLVRRICGHCKKLVSLDEQMIELLALHGVTLETMWEGQGCEKCRNTGYSGRLGLYELLVLDDHLRDKVASNPSITEFRRICVERGMITLRDDGFRKVSQGMTTVEEVLRVTESMI